MSALKHKAFCEKANRIKEKRLIFDKKRHKKDREKSVGQTNFCGSKNACTLAGENACVFRLPVTKMGLLAEILSRFRSTNPEKALKYAKNKNFFQKQGQKKTDFYDIYTVGFPTEFLKGADCYVNTTSKRR